MSSLNKLFIEHCDKKKFEKNINQIRIVNLLSKFNSLKKSFLSLFFKADQKLGFYLYGGVGVGKTMILNFFYNNLDIPKKKFHFNEFMINFHNFRHKYKDQNNSIEKFVKNLKKNCELIYFDEFQITNIVDAMILGKLFETIFKEKIKIIISSNIKIENLYKDGLQREQFIPFLKTIKKNSIEKQLIVDVDYRKSDFNNLDRYFSLKNSNNLFKVNRIFHDLIKDKKRTIKILNVKGRKVKINLYYEGIAKFDFKELCGDTLGAEDYIAICEQCSLIFIENIPIFSNENIDKKQRFITLIDIFYEKKVPLIITASAGLKNINFSSLLSQPFKRTISRLYELTSPKMKI
jgi:cell division protein ZapE